MMEIIKMDMIKVNQMWSFSQMITIKLDMQNSISMNYMNFNIKVGNGYTKPNT